MTSSNSNIEAHPESSSSDPPETAPSRCWRGWCSFSQVQSRRLWIALFVSSVIAISLNDAATDVCGFVDASILLRDGTVETRGVGINVYEDADGECTSWRKGDDKDIVYNDSDTLWKVVRFFVGIASVVALIGVIILGFATCLAFPLFVWNLLAYVWLIVWFLYSLSFVLFGSDLCTGPTKDNYDRDCSIDVGAWLTLAGVIVWIPSSLGVWYLAGKVSPGASTEDDSPRPGEEDLSPPSSDQEESRPESRSHRKLFLGWAIAAGLLLVASAVTNAVLIASA